MAHRIKTLMTLLLMGIYLSTGGCATMVRSTSQDIGIDSDPSGAEVLINPGNIKLVTPGTVNLKRGNTYSVSFKKEGYEDSVATIFNSMSGWVWMNVAFLNPFGPIIDAVSGAGFDLEPPNIHVLLHEKYQSIKDNSKELNPESQMKEKREELVPLDDQLRKLEKMKSEGTITEDEYSKLKEKIIDKSMAHH